MAQHIIIGNGIAANTAAETYTESSEPGSSIRMFSREKHCFYYTPALPEFLSGEKDVKGMTLHNEQWYAERNIELHLNTEIAAIDPAKKMLLPVIMTPFTMINCCSPQAVILLCRLSAAQTVPVCIHSGHWRMLKQSRHKPYSQKNLF